VVVVINPVASLPQLGQTVFDIHGLRNRPATVLRRGDVFVVVLAVAELAQMPEGIRNLHPQSGEPAFFADKRFVTAPNDGEAYALIFHAPGPLASTAIQSFTSSRTWVARGLCQP
jgi:hypothetical protein